MGEQAHALESALERAVANGLPLPADLLGLQAAADALEASFEQLGVTQAPIQLAELVVVPVAAPVVAHAVAHVAEPVVEAPAELPPELAPALAEVELSETIDALEPSLPADFELPVPDAVEALEASEVVELAEASEALETVKPALPDSNKRAAVGP